MSVINLPLHFLPSPLNLEGFRVFEKVISLPNKKRMASQMKNSLGGKLSMLGVKWEMILLFLNSKVLKTKWVSNLCM